MRVPLTLPPADRGVDVVTLGENSLDFVAELLPGSPGASKRPLGGFALRVGGQMATAAVGVARLGFRSKYIGAFGNDDWGARIRSELDASGVDVRAMVRANTASRIAVVLVDENGDRQILEHREPALALRADEIEPEATSGRLLLLDATSPAAAVAAARLARRAGIPVIVDVDRVSPETDSLLAEIDVIIVPEHFVIEWAGVYDLSHGLERMAARFPIAQVVLATRGQQGSLALAGGHWIETPGFHVPVVDTTGAGDAFRAGFAAGWLRETGEPDLARILSFANATAALNCRFVGAQAGLPAMADVEALFNERQV